MHIYQRKNCSWIKKSKHSKTFDIVIDASKNFENYREQLNLLQADDKSIKELCNYYKMELKSSEYNGSYFWLSLKIENQFNNIYTPDYYFYSDIKDFLHTILKMSENDFFSDQDQGWGLDLYVKNNNIYFKYFDPETNKVFANVYFDFKKFKQKIRKVLKVTDKLSLQISGANGWNYWEHNPFIYSRFWSPIKLILFGMKLRLRRYILYLIIILKLFKYTDIKIALFNKEKVKFAECQITNINFSSLEISAPILVNYTNYGENSYNSLLFYLILVARRLRLKHVTMKLTKNDSFVLHDAQNKNTLYFLETQGWKLIDTKDNVQILKWEFLS